jgi:NADH:ubiquinone oxidoreductase subunit 6 (subunit J)
MIETIAFYLFSAILVASAIMVVTRPNPVHSVRSRCCSCSWS